MFKSFPTLNWRAFVVPSRTFPSLLTLYFSYVLVNKATRMLTIIITDKIMRIKQRSPTISEMTPVLDSKSVDSIRPNTDQINCLAALQRLRKEKKRNDGIQPNWGSWSYRIVTECLYVFLNDLPLGALVCIKLLFELKRPLMFRFQFQ